MTASPIICFGQQPCGFFPRRYLFAKFQTARRLQSEIGGSIVFFCHDSDHDPRETRTILRHRKLDTPLSLNFSFVNQTQRKFTPLFLKDVVAEWHEKTGNQLHGYVDPRWIEVFEQTQARKVADFCLEMYRRMGLLDGISVVRSSAPSVRGAACDISEFYVDAPFDGETVRARWMDGELKLHKGGDSFITLPAMNFTKEQISPTRDSRLRWMQSIIHCTHYIAGAGEQAYLRKEDAPEISYVQRDNIERSDEAYTEIPG